MKKGQKKVLNVVTQFKELDGLEEKLSKEEIYIIIEEVVTKYYKKNKDIIKNTEETKTLEENIK